MNIQIIILDYWVIFFKPSTFIFKERLANYLTKFDISKNLYFETASLLCCTSKSLINKNYLHFNTLDEVKLFIKNNLKLDIQDDLFLNREHENEWEIKNVISFGNVNNNLKFYQKLNDEELNPSVNDNYIDDLTAFVLITDWKYFDKAKRTIIDLRSVGNWKKDIVVITVDFNLNQNFVDFYNIIQVQFENIDKRELLLKLGNGFANSDKRELNKLNQWEKLHVFDDIFKKWNRIIYLDSGLRVLDNVESLLKLDYKNKLLAPNDIAPYYHTNKPFRLQLDFENEEKVKILLQDFDAKIFNEEYFLNCIWIYDTQILNICTKKELIDGMNKYTLCRTNEMGIMNLFFNFKYNLWKEFPLKVSNKYLFEWNETNHKHNTTWRDYCLIKYPFSISFIDV